MNDSTLRDKEAPIPCRPISYSEFSCLVKADLYRYRGQLGSKTFWSCLQSSPGFSFTYYLRLCRFLRRKPQFLPFYVFARRMLRRFTYRFGISIDPCTEIGPGLYIGHFSGIIVNVRARIGSNCNLSPNTVIGQANRGERAGYPTIGNNVYIGPNVNIVGRVTIGNNVAIGAGSVVIRDVPDNVTVAGVPAKIISETGSEGYVNRVLITSCPD
jgi:serine O-acetyltransferase